MRSSASPDVVWPIGMQWHHQVDQFWCQKNVCEIFPSKIIYRYNVSEKPTWTWMTSLLNDMFTRICWRSEMHSRPTPLVSFIMFAWLKCTWKKIHFEKYILEPCPNFWHLEDGKTMHTAWTAQAHFWVNAIPDFVKHSNRPEHKVSLVTERGLPVLQVRKTPLLMIQHDKNCCWTKISMF